MVANSNIYRRSSQRLSEGEDVSGKYFLVAGAGGAARAAAFVGKRLGFKLLYWNRTPEKVRSKRLGWGARSEATKLCEYP